MPKFQFKLKRLLRVREIGEELARAEVALARSEADNAREVLAAARVGLATAERELVHTREHNGARAALLAERMLPPLLRRIVSGRQRLQAAELAAEAALDVWQARRTDVRALEKLEERARAAFAESDRAREDRVLQETIERRAALTGRAQHNVESER